LDVNNLGNCKGQPESIIKKRDATCPITPEAATGGAPAPVYLPWSPLAEPAKTTIYLSLAS
jgi:hypothetical protein